MAREVIVVGKATIAVVLRGYFVRLPSKCLELYPEFQSCLQSWLGKLVFAVDIGSCQGS